MATRLKVGSLFLNNSTGFGVAGGAATGESTTPWATRDANWTPRAPTPIPIWGGGPPFTSGRRLAYQSHDDVTEQIPLLLDVSDHNDAAAELQLLRQEISKGIALVPPLVEIKPNGATNSMYAEIKTGWVQEEGILESPAGGRALRMRVTLTIIRGPYFGRLSTGETLLNAVAFTNTFSGGTDNIAAYSAGTGDLIYEGGPLNLSFTNNSGMDLTGYEYYFGTIDSITTDATTQTVTTSSTTGAAAASGDTITVGTVLDAKQATNMRLIAQVSSVTGGAYMRLKVSLSSVATPFFIGPWLLVGANDQRYDAGVIPSYLFRDLGLTTIYVLLEVKGGGGSVTVTLSNFYVIYEYTMCKVSNITTIVDTTGVLKLRSFVETSGRACLPLRRAEVYVLNSTAQTYYGLAVGRPPVYISGASLFFMATWPISSGGSPPVVSASITATHGALFKTFRGAS